MHVIVVGAGLMGLTTAWFLRQHGVDVSVIERASGAGLETSFANGGMLHASQASPWNEPGVLRQALGMLGREDAALLIRPRALLGMLPWAWGFFRNARSDRYLANLAKNTRLAAYSLQVLETHFSAFAELFGRAERGTLKIYRTAEELAAAQQVATRCLAFDVRYDILDAAAVVALEPALTPIRDAISGGIHFPGDVSGDAHLFCRALAERGAANGIRFDFETNVDRLLLRGARCEGVECAGEVRLADACVLAAGSFSPLLLRTLGISLPVQPVKGYSLTIPLEGWPVAPQVPVIDEHFHAAACPLGGHLRVAGTAEFAGFDAALTNSRIENLYTLVERLYPAGAACIDRRQVAHWTGLRPMSPDGVGIMGETAIGGLFVNTGHGHLGWTMAPGAGKLVADRIAGSTTDLALDDFLPARFRR
ncbi:MAG: D-amino acid dehydrogenase [Gammaproteobacteria bacterium]